MADQGGRSVEQIKAETERTRAGLTDTVEQLRASVSETANEVRQRISPTAIKAEVTDYIRGRRDDLVDDMMTMVRDNPMQAAAIGAAVGYPLYKIARAIPMPIVLIGAGLFLTSTKKGKAWVNEGTDYATRFADRTVHQAQDFGNQVSQTFRDTMDQGRDTAARAKEAAMARVGQVSDSVSDTLSSAQSAAKSWVGGKAEGGSSISQGATPYAGSSAGHRNYGFSDQTSRGYESQNYRDASGGLRQSASDAMDTATRSASSAFDAGLDAARTARDSAYEAARRANQTIGSTVQSNPLLVAGLGLVIGALIASSLPRTEIEDRFVGPTSDELKARAQDAAADQLETVKNTASGIVDNVVESAKREGLSTDGLEASAQDIGQRVRRVAEAGISTALKDNGENNKGGERNHG